MFTWGDSYFKVSDMSMGMRFNADAKALGFRDHDVMLGTDQGPFREYANVNGDFFRQIAQAKRVDVLRNGKKHSIALPGDMDMLPMIKTRPYFVEPFIPAQVDSVMGGSPAARAGIKAGDLIRTVNGKKIETWSDMNYQMGVLDDVMSVKNTHKDSLAARSVVLTVQHKGVEKLDTVKMVLTPDLKLGVLQATLATYYKPVQEKYGFFESFPAGIKHGWNVLRGYVGNFRYLASADGAKSIGGFGAIGSLFPPYWDWYMFWSMTAFLSIILAFMNILPIPALDGGHVVFLLYEMITRRKPSEKFMIRAEYVGITLLILLMIFANLNDILRWLHIM
ncbi:MAG: site-2 protease family protein, partial [Prevotella denticola]